MQNKGRAAGEKLSGIIIDYLKDWVNDHVIQRKKHGVFISKHAPSVQFLNYVYPLFRPTGLAGLFRDRWEIIYTFNPVQPPQDAVKDVHKALRGMYPEGDRTLMERRSKMRCFDLKLGAKGAITAGKYELPDVKAKVEVEGKMMVGSTELKQTQRPSTRTLRRKLMDITSIGSKKHLVLLDKASDYPISSLCNLGAAIRTVQDRFRLVFLCSSDVQLQNLLFCDKCELCYDPQLTDIIYPRFQTDYPMFSKDAVDKILAEGNGVPSRISRLASITYGTYELLRKNPRIDKKFIENLLTQIA
ncbi:MAG: hypothetical protein OEW62_01245 [Candidatus Bathyarchaeota archaeon]|nr:hypothetical protein [Candidatus Bathyarchaeota archaeon]MDH5595207.1 hypothetical protein [Candidatus Bathyarchaeota archaeon]